MSKVNGDAAGNDGLLRVVLGVNANDTDRLQVLGFPTLFGERREGGKGGERVRMIFDR